MKFIQKDYTFPKVEGVFFAIKFYHKFLGYTLPFTAQKMKFSIKDLSVSPTKVAQKNCGFGHIYWRNP